MTTEEKIADVERQLNNPKISPPRKHDLTKHLRKLRQIRRKELQEGV